MYSDWINILNEVDLFDNIKQNDLINMLDCIKPKINYYKNKDIITYPEDDFIGIGIILKGGIVIANENVLGERSIVAKLKKGDMFGEVIAFSNIKKWHVTIVATEECGILYLPPEKIVGNCPKMCTGHKLLIQNMLKIISNKALYLNRKISYLNMRNIRDKVSFYLLEQYKNNNTKKFKIPFNRNELAQYLNISRPSLSRELINMKKDGLIRYNKDTFEIININKFKLY